MSHDLGYEGSFGPEQHKPKPEARIAEIIAPNTKDAHIKVGDKMTAKVLYGSRGYAEELVRRFNAHEALVDALRKIMAESENKAITQRADDALRGVDIQK